MSGVQLVGTGGASLASVTQAAEVETNTKALRAMVRPIDYGNLGIYSVGANSGTMTAGLAAASPIFSFRYPATNICIVKRILFGAIGGGTGFAAGTGKFDLICARSFTASDTGGNDFSAVDQHRLRQSMAYKGFATGTGLILASSTATLTAGTRTLDAQPLASLAAMCSATASTVMVPANTALWDERAGEMPLVLAQNEGFVIQATVTATGTWVFAVNVKWAELTAY